MKPSGRSAYQPRLQSRNETVGPSERLAYQYAHTQFFQSACSVVHTGDATRASRPSKVLVLPRDPIASRLGRVGTQLGASAATTRGRHTAVPRPSHFSKPRSLGGKMPKPASAASKTPGSLRASLPPLAGCPILPNRVRTGLGPCRIAPRRYPGSGLGPLGSKRISRRPTLNRYQN
jgi:hypothetical protein